MSEYELVSLIGQLNEHTLSNLTVFISLLSGYIITLFFASEKLPKSALMTITTIWSVFIFAIVFSTANTLARIGMVREELLLLNSASAGPLIQGINATTYNSSIMIATLLFVCFGSYLASLWFLIYQLRKKSQSVANT